MDIQILNKSLCTGRNKRSYLQFNTFRQLLALVSDVYSATSTYHKSRYSLKSHQGIILNMYEGAMQSALMERFVKGVKRRIPEDSDRNKPVNSLVVS